MRWYGTVSAQFRSLDPMAGPRMSARATSLFGLLVRNGAGVLLIIDDPQTVGRAILPAAGLQPARPAGKRVCSLDRLPHSLKIVNYLLVTVH
jgi:hypothetical protein